jgi:Domain of unknown function (DUF4365)
MPGVGNALQGDFGESWLEAVAAGCGLSHGRPDALDLDKADVQLMLRGVVAGTYNPTVKVQVKTEVGLLPGDDGAFSYSLDIETYDVLRREDHVIRRILVVIGLKADGSRVRLQDHGTLLVGHGAWVSLEGRPKSQNAVKQVVKLLVTNTIDPAGLERMLREYGVRSTATVPVVDLWRASSVSGREEEE